MLQRLHRWLCRIGIHYTQRGTYWSYETVTGTFRVCRICARMWDDQ